MANAMRGETVIHIGGVDYTVCGTLGVMAASEERLGVDSMGDAFSQIFNPYTNDSGGEGYKVKYSKIAPFIECFLVGNGYQITDDVRKSILSLKPNESTNIALALFMTLQVESEGGEEGNPLAEASDGNSGAE